MKECETEKLPVYEDNHLLGYISRNELIDFLNQEEDGRNIYYHKINFDLGTALIKIREQKSQTTERMPEFKWVAAIALICSIIFWFYNNPATYHTIKASFSSGSNFAKQEIIVPEIIFANGNTILLDTLQHEVIISKDKISYSNGNNVLKSAPWASGGSLNKASKDGPVTVLIPKGHMYQVTLSDGTRVWLNADTKLTLPATSFGVLERKVELIGEGYFEVAKHKELPFLVKNKHQEITVLGTHFNIESYPDQDNVKTTLLEGSVRVSSHHSKSTRPDRNEIRNGREIVLKPGEQSVLSTGSLKVQKVDVQMAVAWKRKELAFRNESLENIMIKLARRYKIEVFYQDQQIGKLLLGGTIPTSGNLQEVLQSFELLSGVHFKVDGNKVTIRK